MHMYFLNQILVTLCNYWTERATLLGILLNQRRLSIPTASSFAEVLLYFRYYFWLFWPVILSIVFSVGCFYNLSWLGDIYDTNIIIWFILLIYCHWYLLNHRCHGPIWLMIYFTSHTSDVLVMLLHAFVGVIILNCHRILGCSEYLWK